MPRCHGSYIGHVPEPDDSAASGIWKACDARELLADGKWPSQPAVPGAPTAAPGDEQVVLTWPEITTSPSVTDYGIQYSDDAGETWTTFTDSVSGDTTATVTGLTNGTAYVFRLFGVNALGDGPYGSASAAVTPFVYAFDLLMHFDGTNGSTSLPILSPQSATATAFAAAAISTAQSKFGGASLFMSSSGGGCVYIHHSGQFDFGTSDFTFEFWLRLDSVITGTLFGGGGDAFSVAQFSNGSIAVGRNGTGWQHFTNAGVLSTGQWQHIAIARQGSTLRIFVDGVNELPSGSSNNTDSYSIPAGVDAEIGTPSSAFTFTGYLDELRIVKGTAAYTANFTPPTAPF